MIKTAMAAADYPAIEQAQVGQAVQIQVPVTPPLSLAEGPLWDDCEQRLLFSDVNASKIYALSADGTVSVFASNTGNANGLAYDVDGSLIMAQMGGNPGHLARLDDTGKITAIEPPGSPRLHTPDDVVVRSDGTIYFTDGDFPPVGNFDLAKLPIYSLAPGGSRLVEGGRVTGPNGIELSPDEKTLYVDAEFQSQVVAFDVADDGSLTPSFVLASGLLNPDSLCLDAAGNLYVGVSGGLQVLRPDGSKAFTIPIASLQGVTNCTFGGPDGTTLYVTAWTTLWKIDNMPIPGLDWLVDQTRQQCR